jgi:hypothetical protein
LSLDTTKKRKILFFSGKKSNIKKCSRIAKIKRYCFGRGLKMGEREIVG